MTVITHPFVNTLKPRQNGRHFTDDIFKCICFNEDVCIPIKISLESVPKVQLTINQNFQVMAWRRTGDKPLPQPMMTQIHNAYMRHPASSLYHSANNSLKWTRYGQHGQKEIVKLWSSSFYFICYIMLHLESRHLDIEIPIEIPVTAIFQFLLYFII